MRVDLPCGFYFVRDGGVQVLHPQGAAFQQVQRDGAAPQPPGTRRSQRCVQVPLGATTSLIKGAQQL
jgi:hypothetical protein